MKKLLKTTVLVAAAFAFGSAVVACDDSDGPGQTPESTKYTVSYAIGDGATGTAPASIQKAKDEKFNLPAYDAASAEFSKDGYTFDGWHDGTAKYAAGYEYTMPGSNVTFTAQWTLESEGDTTYTITYDLNGGTGTTPTQDAKKEGETITLAAVAGFTKTGFIFAGWKNGDITYKAGDEYTVGTADVTFTAQWVAELPEVQETIEFEGKYTLPEKNGYLGAKGGETVVGIKFATVTENGASKRKAYYKLEDAADYVDGKYFDDATGSIYKPDKYGVEAYYYEIKIGEINYYALVKPDLSELTLCDTDDNLFDGAVFTKTVSEAPTTVTVTFDLNWYVYGVENPPAQSFANGGTATAPTVPQRSGHTFDGWHVGSEDGALFDFDTPVTSNITLVAKWTANATYTATFIAPDGATGEAPAPVEMSSSTKFPANTFTKEGWTFVGWTDSTAKDGSIKLQNAPMTFAVNKTFVAVFKKTYGTSAYGYADIEVRDDGYFVDLYDPDEPSVIAYTVSNGLLNYEFYGTMVSLRLNADATYDVADGMQFVSLTANDNVTTLTFDGFGNAKLGEHNGTYTYDYGNTIDLVFGETEYNEAPVGFDDETNLINSITVTITVDGTAYTFGAVPPGPGPDDPGDETLTGKLSDFLGDSTTSKMTYGYASSTAAAEANNALTVQYNHPSNGLVEVSFYKAEAYYNQNSSRYAVVIYRPNGNLTASIGASTTTDADGNAISDKTADNQKLKMTATNYVNEFEITFHIVNGVKTLTIKCGDVTVDWTLI